MKILYVSGLASSLALSDARKIDPDFSGYSAQKFNRLVAEGLVNNGHQVTSLSSFFLPNKSKYYRRKKESFNGVQYRYISSLGNSHMRHFWIMTYCFFYVLFWGIRKKNEKAVVCDVLRISACLGAVLATRLNHLRCVGIMTDMPGLMIDRSTNKSKQSPNTKKAITKINKRYLGYFSHYVFLTEQMNSVVNINRRPYIVMEGLVDSSFAKASCNNRYEKRVVLYAGGLHERYGLRMLVEAFMKTEFDDAELWLYGDGPFVEDILDYNRRDSRIVYKGIQPNEEVVAAELKATLLVNPRPTREEFTKYSFPSKNMEYMVSGTPLLTTKLPGMPAEYYPYVFLFEEETIGGYYEALQHILSLPSHILYKKGAEAQQWILRTKNNNIQTIRIIKLLS